MAEKEKEKSEISFNLIERDKMLFPTVKQPKDSKLMPVFLQNYLHWVDETLELSYERGHYYLNEDLTPIVSKAGYRQIAENKKVKTINAECIFEDKKEQQFIFRAKIVLENGRELIAEGAADGREKKFITKKKFDVWEKEDFNPDKAPRPDPTKWWKVRSNAETRAVNRALDHLTKGRYHSYDDAESGTLPHNDPGTIINLEEGEYQPDVNEEPVNIPDDDDMDFSNSKEKKKVPINPIDDNDDFDIPKNLKSVDENKKTAENPKVDENPKPEKIDLTKDEKYIPFELDIQKTKEDLPFQIFLKVIRDLLTKAGIESISNDIFNKIQNDLTSKPADKSLVMSALDSFNAALDKNNKIQDLLAVNTLFDLWKTELDATIDLIELCRYEFKGKDEELLPAIQKELKFSNATMKWVKNFLSGFPSVKTNESPTHD